MKKTLLAVALLGTALSTSISPALADQYDRSVTIHNNSDGEIVYVHAKHVENCDWGLDLLGSEETIKRGSSSMIDPINTEGYCMFLVRGELNDGRKKYSLKNLCDATDVYLK